MNLGKLDKNLFFDKKGNNMKFLLIQEDQIDKSKLKPTKKSRNGLNKQTGKTANSQKPKNSLLADINMNNIS